MSNDFDPFPDHPGVHLIRPEQANAREETAVDEDESEVIEQSVPVLFYTIVFFVVFSGTLGLLLMFKDIFNPF